MIFEVMYWDEFSETELWIEAEFTVNRTFYGADADGNRGESCVFVELDHVNVLDDSGKPCKNKDAVSRAREWFLRYKLDSYTDKAAEEYYARIN